MQSFSRARHGVHQGQAAYSAQIHEQDQDALGDCSQLRCDAQGQAHGADGGGALKEGFLHSDRLQLDQRHAGNQKQGAVEHRDHQGAGNDLGGDAAAKAMNLMIAGKGRPKG